MSIDKLLNDAEVSELKQKNDLINVFTLMSMWAQVIPVSYTHLTLPTICSV